YRAGIKDQVRAAIGVQTKHQVNRQIVRYVPVPLEKQAIDSKRRLAEVKIALANSEARAQNAMLDSSSEYEPLAVVLTDSGERSAYYPADLGSLFSYDGECFAHPRLCIQRCQGQETVSSREPESAASKL
ncbi:hypothetical protein P691DRAFT_663049, partial [Macrolepiota fuliginosa MF-IS2]